MSRVISSLNRTSPHELIIGVVGLVVGLIIGILATIPIPRHIPIIGDYVPLIVTLSLGYIAMAVSLKKKEELLHLFNIFPAQWIVDTCGASGALSLKNTLQDSRYKCDN